MRVVVTFVLVAAALATSCGGTETADREPIGVQAPSVMGELLVIDDLTDTDTVLWFWAPW